VQSQKYSQTREQSVNYFFGDIVKKLLIILYSALHFCIASAAPVNIVLPVPPGGVMTDLALTLSQILNEGGVDNFVSYLPGADGDIAYNAVLKQQDNVIFEVAVAHSVFSNVLRDRDNIYTKNMTMIAPVIRSPLGFVSSSKNFNSVRELIDYAKTTPLPCGVSAPHGSVELARINKKYGTKFEPVPYKGNSQLRPDLVEGALRCALDSVGSHIPLHNDGKLKILSVTHATRGLDVTMMDHVLSGYTFDNWFGFAIPKDSNLLKDDRVMKIINNLYRSKKLEPLFDAGFLSAIPQPDIDKTMTQQTENYRQLLKK